MVTVHEVVDAEVGRESQGHGGKDPADGGQSFFLRGIQGARHVDVREEQEAFVGDVKYEVREVDAPGQASFVEPPLTRVVHQLWVEICKKECQSRADEVSGIQCKEMQQVPGDGTTARQSQLWGGTCTVD